MQVSGSTIDEYISNIPEERRAIFAQLRSAILTHLPKGMVKQMSYGMLGYVVPKTVYSAGYHCNTDLPLPFANLASQKNNISFYHMGIYADMELLAWFKKEYSKRCKYTLDMGKSCVRFKRIEDIPVGLIGELMTKMSTQDWIHLYEEKLKK